MSFAPLSLIACLAVASFGYSSASYTCPLSNSIGKRIHEMTSATPYDCRDYSCANTCQGGQCVALVTCTCTNSNGYHPPGTNCWSPGTKLKTSDGKCNRNVPSGTAIATFSSSGSYTNHAAIFAGCLDDYTIRVVDQWCCRSVGYSNYASSHSYFSAYAVIENPSCADRTWWECRTENPGPTCCPTWVEGCTAHKYWWVPFSADRA